GKRLEPAQHLARGRPGKVRVLDPANRVDDRRSLLLTQERLVLARDVLVGGDVAENRWAEPGRRLKVDDVARMDRVEGPVHHRHLPAVTAEILRRENHRRLSFLATLSLFPASFGHSGQLAPELLVALDASEDLIAQQLQLARKP